MDLTLDSILQVGPNGHENTWIRIFYELLCNQQPARGAPPQFFEEGHRPPSISDRAPPQMKLLRRPCLPLFCINVWLATQLSKS